MESNVVSADAMAAWLILQLAEQGRPHEVVAQFMASWLMSSDLDQAEISGWRLDWQRVQDRAFELCLDPSEIWDGLLPGGPNNGLPPFEIIDGNEWAKLHDAQRKLEAVEEAWKTNYGFDGGTVDHGGPWDKAKDYEGRLKAIGRILFPLTEPQSHEPNGIDEYTYEVSIIVDPRVGGRVDTSFGDDEIIPATSPLNLADRVFKKIDQLDRTEAWPAEELSALIVHRESGSHFIMQFNQAEGIKALEEAQTKLEIDLDDEFQAIYEEMILAGNEYIAGREPCGQALYHNGKLVGYCSMPKYTEHDHG